MLWFALAALVPLIIHFWSRQKFELVPWAAMSFLAAAMRRHSRRLRLEQWLLLTVRCAILLLLALALADPVISRFPGMGTNRDVREPVHFVLVIDGSYSMLAESDGQSRFEMAIEQAQRWIDEARQGDGFTVVLMADPPRLIIGRPAFDRADVRAEIQSLSPTHTAAQITSTLLEVEQLVARVEREHPEFSQVRVGIFSDLERASWQSVESDSGRQLIDRLARQGSLVLFDVGQEEVNNVAVVDLQQLQPATSTGVPATWEAVIENFSERPVASLDADWIVDGQVVQHESLSLPGHQTRSLQLEQTFIVPGPHHVELSLSDDGLEVDNHRWQVSQVKETIQVLCVEGRPGETELLELALDPLGQGARSITSRRISIGGLVEESLEHEQLVCLSNVARFSRDEASVLSSFVTNGGCLAIFLGDQVQADNYNQLLGSEAATSLIPGRLAATAPLGHYQLDPLGYRHPLLSVFRGQQRAGLLTTPVNCYQRIELMGGEASDAVRVVLALGNGDPLVIDHRVGDGEVLVFTTAISPHSTVQDEERSIAWSELGSWPSFLPLMQEMVVLAVSRDQLQRNLLVGNVLRGRPPEGIGQLSAEIVIPQGESQRLAIHEVDDRLRWAFDQTAWSGLYEVRYGGPSSPKDLFAVNIDSRESALLRIAGSQLPAALRREMVAVDDQMAPVEGSGPLPLFQWLLAAVLGLVLTETWLSHRQGRAVP